MLNIYGVEAYTQAFTPSFFAPIRLALAGDAQVTDTSLCNCHWQLLDFDSLRGAPPRRGRQRKRIATTVCGLVRNDNISSGLIIDESGSPFGDPDFWG